VPKSRYISGKTFSNQVWHISKKINFQNKRVTSVLTADLSSACLMMQIHQGEYEKYSIFPLYLHFRFYAENVDLL
jgi:hypothetical protein